MSHYLFPKAIDRLSMSNCQFAKGHYKTWTVGPWTGLFSLKRAVWLLVGLLLGPELKLGLTIDKGKSPEQMNKMWWNLQVIGLLPLNHHSGRFRRGWLTCPPPGRFGHTLWRITAHKISQGRSPPPPPPPPPGSAYVPCACFGLQGTKLRNEILIPQVWFVLKEQFWERPY